MKNKKLLLALCVAGCPIASAASLVQQGSFSTSDLTTAISSETAPLNNATDFLKTAAGVLNIPFDELKVLNKPRAPKTELLILALLHQKSHADLESLVAQRQKGKNLDRLVTEHGEDYKIIFLEAWRFKKQIEQKMRGHP